MNKQAFTLIELLVVIAIIGILAGFIIVSMSGASDAANDSRRKADINQLAKAVMIWKTNNPDTLFPVDVDGCNIGDDCTDIFGSASVLRDPNGSYYTYTSVDGTDFSITSVLSNDNDYSFESSTGRYIESTPIISINGTCGTDNDTVTLSTPTNTCSTGIPTSVTTDSNTVLLMHMDGTDNGTVFSDQTGKTVTRYGDTKTVIGTRKFGSAAAYFDGSGDILTLSDSDDWYLGEGVFTIDFWTYLTAYAPNRWAVFMGQKQVLSLRSWTVCYQTYSDNNAAGGTNTVGFYTSSTGLETGVNVYSWVGLPPLNQWVHLAFVYNGTDLNYYMNGVRQTPYRTNFAHPANISSNLEIGAEASVQGITSGLIGYMDEVRISKGITRWTSDFTPPNSQYYWWNWGCSGVNGGSSDSCGANKYQ
ncbi:hypothetical protein MNSC_09050 [Minisyncoccus archaeophilus]|uniref:LamG-like jellyroll fold domain-containing protein n=1 Tax=Minisyncoccus archaeiphilus TaxID=3238481 RepID=UPI00399CE579